MKISNLNYQSINNFCWEISVVKRVRCWGCWLYFVWKTFHSEKFSYNRLVHKKTKDVPEILKLCLQLFTMSAKYTSKKKGTIITYLNCKWDHKVKCEELKKKICKLRKVGNKYTFTLQNFVKSKKVMWIWTCTVNMKFHNRKTHIVVVILTM